MAAFALVLLAPLAALTPKKLSTNANPPQYAPYSRLLSPQQRVQHALERLTYGARPGDEQALEKIGLDAWINVQLHSESIPENPLLAEKLIPYDSLRMSIAETYAHYPPPQQIAAVAHGKEPPPQDPELRQVVLRLTGRYLHKKDGEPPEQDTGSESQLAQLLSPAQREVLREGSAPEKKNVLASLAPPQYLGVALALSGAERRQLLPFAPVQLRRQMLLVQNPRAVVADDLAEGKLLRDIYSNRQLQELMTDFWYNHFNVFVGKGMDHYLTPTYERDAIRPHVFSKFYDLLLATAQSPAMLFYLDNAESVDPQSHAAGRKKHGLNENYGRELLELHTLGVDGGYTQNDVIAVARCFTGWTIARARKGGTFEYNDRVHDKGEKVVLGHVIKAGGGISDGLEVLNILAHSPATAHFISISLAKKFVSDDPPPSLIKRMEETFRKRDGDIREVMRTILSSPEFWSEGAYRAKVKTPLELVVSAVRSTNTAVGSVLPLVNEMRKLGEPLYAKVEPTGYSNSNGDWISSASLVERMNFASALAHDKLYGLRIDLATVSFLEQNASPQTRRAMDAAGTDAPAILSLFLGAPEFQKR